MKHSKPRLAVVSIGIRRDLLAPLGYVSKFELAHFYKNSVYGDLTAEDIDETLRAYRSPFDLYQRLVRAEPNVIQGVEPFSYYTQPYLWACFFAARKTRAALLVGTHENRPLKIKFGAARAWGLKKILRGYFARACLIITHNDGARENVLDCGGAPEKIVRGMWGNWGVDTREFFPRTARESTQPPTILFVGRLVAEKGVLVLSNAFAQVRAKIPHARLVYVGEGPARAELERNIQARGIAESVKLVGAIKHRDIPAWMRRADVFCAPSLTTRNWAEQVGSAALQAMASGLPIVAARSGAIPEYVPDGVAGILVEENNPRAFADALLALLENPTRAQELGQRGRAYAATHYDARANVERGEQLVLEHCVR